jgi:2-C-methyl-D-erythritol 4-phosphate cytidylyltransferase/2-C-methyl-D-erythritol 2,4-cyclodiphosphate synthase
MIRGERVAAIVAAGGSGVRAGLRKQWLELGGETVLRRAARVLAASEAIDELVVVVPPGDEERGAGEAQGLGKPARAVAGGAARADSVRNGARAAEGCGIVLVHDAARPFATAALVARVAEAAARDGAALAALPVTDTVKRSAPSDGKAPPRVEATLDRRALWLAQTPQAFRRDLLLAAFDAAGDRAADATDECALVEAFGAPVTLVPGEPGNFKITGPDDVARARAALEAPVAMGVGYDTHRFSEGRKLVLGGVEFEGDGLLGHSDADVCAHAIGDAILGAAGLGDLGRHFPDTDLQWKGVSSLALLREIAAKASAAGFRVGNCDVTLAARRPKIAPRAEEMRARLAEALGALPAQVNVKATTGEGMGFVGRGEGIAAHAVALLVRVR